MDLGKGGAEIRLYMSLKGGGEADTCSFSGKADTVEKAFSQAQKRARNHIDTALVPAQLV